jgi:hypothetical protein
MSDEADRRGKGFWIALGVGWAVIGYAVVGLVGSRQGLDGAVRVGVWIAAGHLIHDLLLAPVVVLAGLGVARLVGPRWRPPIWFGLVASAAVIGVAYPALRGYGRNPANLSMLPLHYPSAVLTVLGVVWVVVVIWLVARALTRPTSVEPG